MAMTQKPEGIITATLEVVVMPNGEVLSAGKSLGWFETFRRFLTPVADVQGKPIRLCSKHARPRCPECR